MEHPLVSISCITYNHEPFIRQCLDGFFMQEGVNFEILIHDDASTDGTQDVIREYMERYPGIIKPIFQTENQWSQGIKGMNVTFNFPRAKGKYIALCEGDDYWTDPLKLKKQVDFLEKNKEYVLIGGQASKIYEEEEFKILHPASRISESDFDFDTKYLMTNNPISTLTALFRSGVVTNIPEVYYKSSGGDRRFYLLLSQYGKCRYTTEVFGVYRIHSGGITNKYKGSYKKRIEGFKEQIRNAENWNNYFNKKYSNEEAIIKHKNSLKIMLLAFKSRDFKQTMPFLKNIKKEKLNLKERIIFTFLRIYNKVF